MAVSNYFIKYENKIYTYFNKYLAKIEKVAFVKRDFELNNDKTKYDVVLCGYDRTAHHIYNTVKRTKRKTIILDFNPEIIKKLIHEKIPCIYGDIGNTEVLEKINFSRAKLVVSTIPDKESNLHLLKWVKKQNHKTTVFLTSYQLEDALELYKEGADYVILPHFLGGYHAAMILEETSNDLDKLLKKRLEHIKELHKRKNLGHGAHHLHPEKNMRKQTSKGV